ncbi:hypothetical protein [Natrinema longum]|uniref:Uncharacterized protein n=1 Tax=Natrinema longum TaxID=370324 RepID=A0A8A2UEV9_9EURY|nr:hypothetical protein [Natrinema longum]MBZ6495693.1 hypothetical protein [Natrinema longum]QSW86348.1 hypothetical protein J0X27_05885 [Natrinema longum]
MRQLRSCDFCEADAVGTFEIVPPELEPTDAEQRRVVCCSNCKDRLETLLEPLLARAGADAVDGDRDATADRDRPGAGTPVATDDESTASRSRTSAPHATVSEPTEASDDRAASPASEDEPDPESKREPGSQSESVLEAGITFERDGQAGNSDEHPDDDGVDEVTDSSDPSGPAVDSPTDTVPDSSKSDSTTDAESDSDADASDSQTAVTERTDSSSRPPAAYNKVIRLLRNREFPMKRSAVETLAAGAYDLESHEVEAIVDHAIEDGEFVEKRGKLRRT